MPSLLMRSKTINQFDPENLLSLGFAGRLKLSKRFSFIAEYTLVNELSRNQLTADLYNPLGVGLEIETGGHIFSLNFMNAEYINENSFIPNTKKSWRDGGVRFGFTISRNFSLFKSKNKNPETKSTIY
jgi:nucleoside phosphorylase